VISSQLTSLTSPPKDSRYGKVWVGGIEEAREKARKMAEVK
jgi:hypothetical protein